VNTKAESFTTRLRSNPERWQRLKEILADALEQSSFEERTALLRRACTIDATLLYEAEKLLEHDASIFEEFADFAATRLRENESDRIGERLGAYVIVQELGRGGMGAVYLAQRADGQFHKQAAIKVLKRGTDTDEVLRRFRIERQILAELEHPNITRLLDAGTTADGLPYFVMEFVQGIPITRFVQLEEVDLRARLSLFIKVSAAVEFAHRHHVIHRDIKPHNILVNADREPKLLDFGIAKLLSADSDESITTVAAERRLTPRYAAPEQRAGQPATIATDVYSLGALLQELVTNKPPVADSDSKLSKNVASVRVSKLADSSGTEHRLRGQLDRIVARAMQHDPTQRYSGVADMSQDIARCLSGLAPLSTAQSHDDRVSESLKGRAGSRRQAYIAAAAFSVSVLAVALISWGTGGRWLQNHGIRKPTPEAFAGTVTNIVRSIAVLPFEPLGKDTNDELLGLGMADAIIGRMSNLKQLSVLPTTAVSKYKGPANDPVTAGRALGVDAILSGTVQRTGDRVRPNVQLASVATGRIIWSEKFDQTFTDIFGVQDSISDSVAKSLALNVSADERKQLAKRYTTNTEAYDEYLMGLYFWNTRSRDGLQKAVEHLGRAVQKDPKFVLAYALLADCYYLQSNYHYRTGPQWIQDAKAAVDRALLLDGSIAEAHVAAAMIESSQEDNEVADASLRRALELNPNLTVAHLRYGWALSSSGHLDEAVREIRRAQELDPLSPTNNTSLGLILGFARQFPKCLEYCYKGAELAPNEILTPRELGLRVSFKWEVSTSD
jgi:eukaryotic-like serine/threonine-protein kinase